MVFFVSLLRCFLFLTSFSLDFSCVSLLLGCVEVFGYLGYSPALKYVVWVV